MMYGFHALVILQVHGDVFRPPANGSLLATYVGVGGQILGMSMVTMTFALLGFLSPANRGALMTAMLLLFAFMGLVAGYNSAKLYKSFKGTEWKKMTLKTAFLFPGKMMNGIMCLWIVHFWSFFHVMLVRREACASHTVKEYYEGRMEVKLSFPVFSLLNYCTCLLHKGFQSCRFI